MHLRLCIFQARFRLIAYAVLGAATALMATVPVGLQFRYGDWVIVRATSAAEAAQYWHDGADHLIRALLLVLLFVAADLGATALSVDANRRSLPFLLTRPRPRRYFLWSGWLAGILGMGGVLAIAGVTAFVSLACLSGAWLPQRLLIVYGVVFAASAAMFSLTFAFATATRSALNGYQLAALTMVLYVGVRFFINEFPSGMDPLFIRNKVALILFGWIAADTISATPLVLLLLAAAVLPALAQWGFARRDV